MITSRIKQATNDDLPDIIRIWSQGVGDAMGGLQSDSDFDLEMVFDFFKNLVAMQNDVHKFWLYLDDSNIPIGYCSILPFQTSPLLYNKWAILSLYIDKNHQNSSVGFHLSKHALEYASTTTIKYIMATISSTNHRVKRLSEMMGWKVVGKLPHEVADNDLPETEIIVFEA